MVPTYMPIRSLGTQSFADQETQLNSYTNAAYDEGKMLLQAKHAQWEAKTISQLQ